MYIIESIILTIKNSTIIYSRDFSRIEMFTSKFPKPVYSSFGIPEGGHADDFGNFFGGNRFGQLAGPRNVADNLDDFTGLFKKKIFPFF